ncbi:MraY family glycosyltransferase [Zoogloea sp.]|uniref:MraY family glycosyltransferase n=1 Tax=Zoogloea sp. TaxID=49181 RepID=UPI002621CD1D|nr:glycosyltransferase family 4 protein [uncultured Zoogloea sp.]
MGVESGLLTAAVAAFAVALGVTWLCCRPGSWLYFLDHPNARSLHVRPTPRTGGVGVMAGVVAAALVTIATGGAGRALLAALCGAFVLAGLGLADDRAGLSARLRLLAQLLVAGAFLVVAGVAGGWAMGLLLLLGLVWMGNLYNFMDGSDGLAGGMAVFGFGAFAWAAGLAGESALAAVCAGVAAAAAGFLCFNFHPARIFMGDVGSVPLGFLAGALGLVGWRADAWPLWFPLLVFAPFILDATVTLLRRALRGEKVWQAHRSHYYQRMVQMGLGHRGTALRAYGLMAGCGAAALAGLQMGFSLQCAIITMCITAHLIVGYRIDCAWRRHRAAEPVKP